MRSGDANKHYSCLIGCINGRPLLNSSECKAFYVAISVRKHSFTLFADFVLRSKVVLKFLNHLFKTFGDKDWRFFIPKPEDRLKFGKDVRRARVPATIEGLPILKLVSWQIYWCVVVFDEVWILMKYDLWIMYELQFSGSCMSYRLNTICNHYLLHVIWLGLSINWCDLFKTCAFTFLVMALSYRGLGVSKTISCVNLFRVSRNPTCIRRA